MTHGKPTMARATVVVVSVRWDRGNAAYYGSGPVAQSSNLPFMNRDAVRAERNSKAYCKTTVWSNFDRVALHGA
jgi:hypothetical protein